MATFELIMWHREFKRLVVEIPDDLLDIAGAHELVDSALADIPDEAWQGLGAADDGGVDVTPTEPDTDDPAPFTLDASYFQFPQP